VSDAGRGQPPADPPQQLEPDRDEGAQPQQPQQPQQSEPDLSEAERRRRRAAVFGEVLPETTSDERGEPAGDASDDWLRQQVPPHHT